MSTKYGSRWPTYAQQWDTMSRTRLTTERDVASRLLTHKDRYSAVEKRTGVPWYLIACIHYRESDIDFHTQLAQGDPLGQVSTHVPKGQGPYHGEDAWERAALIALEDVGLTNVEDWRLEKTLYYWERYNGWGYERHGVPSAYVWAGSSIYQGGKYVADGVWDASAIDSQLGCAPILKSLMELDPTIQPVRETPPGVEPIPTPQPEPIPVPTPQLPAPDHMEPQIVLTQDQFEALQKKAQPVLLPIINGALALLPQLGVWGMVATQVLAFLQAVPAIPGVSTNGPSTATVTFLGMIASWLVSKFNKTPEKK